MSQSIRSSPGPRGYNSCDLMSTVISFLHINTEYVHQVLLPRLASIVSFSWEAPLSDFVVPVRCCDAEAQMEQSDLLSELRLGLYVELREAESFLTTEVHSETLNLVVVPFERWIPSSDRAHPIALEEILLST